MFKTTIRRLETARQAVNRKLVESEDRHERTALMMARARLGSAIQDLRSADTLLANINTMGDD